MEGEAVLNESDHEEKSDSSSSFGKGSVGPSQRKLLASKLIFPLTLAKCSFNEAGPQITDLENVSGKIRYSMLPRSTGES